MRTRVFLRRGFTLIELLVGDCNNCCSIYAFHTGGANALFLDGSVHFLTQRGTSQALMVTLASIRGGEVLTSEDF